MQSGKTVGQHSLTGTTVEYKLERGIEFSIQTLGTLNNNNTGFSTSFGYTGTILTSTTINYGLVTIINLNYRQENDGLFNPDNTIQQVARYYFRCNMSANTFGPNLESIYLDWAGGTPTNGTIDSNQTLISNNASKPFASVVEDFGNPMYYVRSFVLTYPTYLEPTVEYNNFTSGVLGTLRKGTNNNLFINNSTIEAIYTP